jgi:hypothetical protein
VNDAHEERMALIRAGLSRCLADLSSDGKISRQAQEALVSALQSASRRFADDDWLPKDYVRTLAKIYPELLHAAVSSAVNSSVFIADVVVIEASIVRSTTWRGDSEVFAGLAQTTASLADAAAAVYVPIRMLNGIDEKAVADLKVAVAGAVIATEGLDSIPKPMAETIVATFSTIDVQRRSPSYEEGYSRMVLAINESILESLLTLC